MSHSTAADSEKFRSIPFSGASITWKKEDASTMSFKSPIRLEEADRVRYKRDNGKDFGGQIYKKKKSTSSEYQYEVISYLRLYHDKVTVSYANKTSSEILIDVLKQSKNNFRTSGIKKTTIKHSNVKWENKSIWDIACQLAWLEHQAGFEIFCEVDANGTLIFRYASEQPNGFIFTEAYDFDEEYDSSNIITASKVTFNGEVLGSAEASKDLIAKWGYVTEVEECASTQSSTEEGTTVSGKRDDAQISKYHIPSEVVNQALSIAKEGNSDYNNLRLLYNWCDSHISYRKYFNTKRGALKTLKDRVGNCCDNAHLMIAMARSIGIKARYCHSKGQCGHVFGEYYVNNKWFICDTGCGKGVWGGYWRGGGRIISRTDTINF